MYNVDVSIEKYNSFVVQYTLSVPIGYIHHKSFHKTCAVVYG